MRKARAEQAAKREKAGVKEEEEEEKQPPQKPKKISYFDDAGDEKYRCLEKQVMANMPSRCSLLMCLGKAPDRQLELEEIEVEAMRFGRCHSPRDKLVWPKA